MKACTNCKARNLVKLQEKEWKPKQEWLKTDLRIMISKELGKQSLKLQLNSTAPCQKGQAELDDAH